MLIFILIFALCLLACHIFSTDFLLENYVVAIAEATVHKQWEETKAQKPKPEYKTKDNLKLFTQQ
jgi:hypothetical protein